MIGLRVDSLSKVFHTPNGDTPVLNGLSLTIKAGEVVAIRGDNGSGKTTLLNIIVGVDEAYSGSIQFGDSSKTWPTIGYVQQDYTSSLLPWFNVIENIAIPLRLRGVERQLRQEKVAAILEKLGFNTLPTDKYPSELSGGQKQRVAIARALIHDPELLLLDEPFSNLDAHSSRDIQETLSRIHAERNLTIIYVSHELDHCIYLADRVLLLHGKPASIHKSFQIVLSRPRQREQILSKEFAETRAEILTEEELLYAQSIGS